MLTRVGGDGVDVGGSDDTHPGVPVVFHAHADANGNSSNDPHDEHDSKDDASNCGAPERTNKSTFVKKGLRGFFSRSNTAPWL